MNKQEIRIFPSPHELSRFAADYIIELIAKKTKTADRMSIALAGGTTPRNVYELMAEIAPAKNIDWRMVHFFWGDERCVSPEDEYSNYRMSYQALLSKIPIPRENIQRIRGELPPGAAAEHYERELRSFFGPVEFPSFDLILLGLGKDCHTASLFPHSPSLREKEKWVISAGGNGIHRVTLTLPVLNSAGQIIFMVTGREKAEAVSRTLSGKQSPDDCPAQAIQPAQGNVLWLLDEHAASHLRITPPTPLV